jgi:hypothetical protein
MQQSDSEHAPGCCPDSRESKEHRAALTEPQYRLGRVQLYRAYALSKSLPPSELMARVSGLRIAVSRAPQTVLSVTCGRGTPFQTKKTRPSDKDPAGAHHPLLVNKYTPLCIYGVRYSEGVVV